MIANISRIKGFTRCREKAFNWDELRLQTRRTSLPLLTGGAFHEGAAKFFATRNMNEAIDEAEANFRERTKDELILPEERKEYEHQIVLARRLTAIFCDHYQDAELQVLQPEVRFRVALPNTHHHCYFFHRIIHPNVPFEECMGHLIERWSNAPQDEKDEWARKFPCIQPHWFQGKTDAVVQWKGKIWLLEHKTTSQSGDIFFAKFQLDMQCTGYIYGIGKQTGIRPAGFILNVLKKPPKNAKDQLAVGFEREPYLRSDEDIERFERQFIRKCNDYETAFVDRVVNNNRDATYMNEEACTDYRRKCEYMGLCLNHTSGLDSEEFVRRESDYINQAYYEVLRIPIPEDQRAKGEEINGINE